jgi:hypothetical protein
MSSNFTRRALVPRQGISSETNLDLNLVGGGVLS